MEVKHWDLRGYEYPAEICVADQRIRELLAELEALISANRKAKSTYTKSVAPLSSLEEYRAIRFDCGKKAQYTFKRLVDHIRQHIDENGDNWDSLKNVLREQFEEGLQTFTTSDDPVMYVVNFFLIATIENDYVQEEPDQHVRIGNWYIRPW